MSLIKKRPKVGLLAPRLLRPGGAFEVTVVLEVEKEIPTEAIKVRLLGDVRYTHGEHQRNWTFLNQVAQVHSDTLSTGEHRHRVRFELPADAPSSYEGAFVDVRYAVEVHVEIPWWPDKRVRFPVTVQALADPRVEEGGRVFVPSLDGAASDDAHFELSLGTLVVEPGGRLHGALAVANVHAKRYRGFEFELVARERSPERHLDYRRVARRWVIASDERLAASGETMPFTLDMPSNLCPDFWVQGFGVEWGLRATLNVAWGRDRSIGLPLHVRVHPEGRTSAMAPVPVAVGDARATEMWRLASEEAGWDFVAGGAATRDLEGLTVTATRRDEGKQRGLLRFDFASLGIELGFRPGRNGGFVADDEGVQSYLRRVWAPVLEACEIIDAHDSSLVVAAGGAALERAEVSALFEHAARIAVATRECFDGLPAAEAWSSRREELETAAQALGGRAQPWSCRVVGRYDGVPYELRVRGARWSLGVSIDPPFSERERERYADKFQTACGDWEERVDHFELARSTLQLELLDAGSVRGFPIELATRLLEPLALRRDGSLGGYR